MRETDRENQRAAWSVLSDRLSLASLMHAALLQGGWPHVGERARERTGKEGEASEGRSTGEEHRRGAVRADRPLTESGE